MILIKKRIILTKMVKIAFQTTQIDVRGSCVALFDYALYNETILGNKSIIVTDSRAWNRNDFVAVRKFRNRFPVFFYRSIEHLEQILHEQKCDIFYTIKYGKKDELVFDSIKTVVHCVFDLSEPHGNVYAAVSDTLAKKFHYPTYVPHMVGLMPSITKENLRKELNIPEDAIVFGRHGGTDTFDLDFVKRVIGRVVRTCENIYFIFMNTPVFDNHPHIIHVEPTADNDEKNRFISTCDAMIHAQSLGETFGLSIAEFSVNNKPIITYNGLVWNDNYKKILKTNAIYYIREEELFNILSTFSLENYSNTVNSYKDFSPYKVIIQFKKVFIE